MSRLPSIFTARSGAAEVSAFPQSGVKQARWPDALTAIVIAGFLLRVAVAILAGGGARTPWGGGGDTLSYILLAQNLLGGKGYAYAGMPTALRAPAYPILLAGAFKLFGGHALAAVRWLQLFEGLAVGLLAAAMAEKLFGQQTGKLALALGLFFPTLVEMNGEVLSEATAALLAAIFLYLLIGYSERHGWMQLLGMGSAIGLGALVRFNMAALGIVALAAIFARSAAWMRWKQAATLVGVATLAVSPWLVRNLLVFHGEVLFSTHGGLDALEGVLTPQGRALPGDAAMLRTAVGWVPPTDIETNDPSRLALGPEPELDAQCRRAAFAIAVYQGWKLIPLVLRKVSDFWLSTDQLFWTAAFPRRERAVRAAGVLAYWALLALGVAGWFYLRSRNPEAARILFMYAALLTAMHLPFVMSTRLRMPLMDPMIAALAGGGLASLAANISEKKRRDQADG